MASGAAIKMPTGRVSGSRKALTEIEGQVARLQAEEEAGGEQQEGAFAVDDVEVERGREGHEQGERG